MYPFKKAAPEVPEDIQTLRSMLTEAIQGSNDYKRLLLKELSKNNLLNKRIAVLLNIKDKE